MNTREISRRELLRQGSTAIVGATLLQSPLLAQAFPGRRGRRSFPS